MNNVLITGAARRIGAAIAQDLAADNWKVAIHFKSSEKKATKLVNKIKDAGGDAVAIQADLGQDNQAEVLINEATQKLGTITCLINNASVFEFDTIETATNDSWHRHLKTNLQAPFFLIKRFCELLPPEINGNVINLLDQRVWNLTPYFTSYTVSKAGLWVLTQSLALALAPRIRINGVGPGPALPSPRQTNQQFIEQCINTPLNRGTTPAEICKAIKFILASPSMTGQMIALDGGQHLGWANSNDNDTPVE
ncbi:MAG: SDR family oxidoreductase [Pseudomonadota bacterium]|nr:SDR family oxidoreductase [Pseudomonadota bacterium]